jgi:hypothetical protein
MKSLSLRTPSVLIASTLILVLVSWSFGFPFWFHTAEAAGLGFVSDTLSDSDLSIDATHTIRFTLVNQIDAGETVLVTFDPTGQLFNLSGVVDTDVTVSAVSGGPLVQVAPASCTGTPDEIYVSDVDAVADIIELTVCSSDAITAGTVIEIVVGGANFINNPAVANSYVIQIGGTMADVGDTRVVVIDNVTASAVVDTAFTFQIVGVGPGVSVNDDVKLTAASSTATTVPFGIIAPDDAKLMAQKLLVDTNALNGFSVTVQADTTLIAGNGATIDEFIDNAATASSTIWQGPASTMGSPDTYGHWGVTSDDNVVSSTTPNKWGAGYATYQGNFTGNNPIEVFYHNTAVTSTAGMGVGSTTVAYKVEISELQEAAKDYTATLTYIATPVF